MGNWRRVHVVGRVGDPVDGMKLYELLEFDYTDPAADWDKFGPLSSTGGGMSLFNMGRRAEFSLVGNLAEREYEVSDVADHLRSLAKACPSLECMVHVGREWESNIVEATVTAQDGAVEVREPMATEIPTVSQDQFLGSMLVQMQLAGKRGGR